MYEKDSNKKKELNLPAKVLMSFFFLPFLLNSMFPIHLVCEQMNESGISILVDGTLTGLNEIIKKLLQLHRVPYYNFDFSIQSFVKMMEGYIRATSPTASNVVFILQDEMS